jgi:hypothetical protein
VPSSYLSYAVLHSNCYTLLLENVSLYFVLQHVLELVTFLGYTCQQTLMHGFSHMSQHPFIPERDYTPLQSFLQKLFTIKPATSS